MRDMISWGRKIDRDRDHLGIRNHHLFHRDVRKFEDAVKHLFFGGLEDAMLPSFLDEHLHLLLCHVGPFGECLSAKGTEDNGGAESQDLDKDGGDLRKGVDGPRGQKAEGFWMHQGNGFWDEFTEDERKVGDHHHNNADGDGLGCKGDHGMGRARRKGSITLTAATPPTAEARTPTVVIPI